MKTIILVLVIAGIALLAFQTFNYSVYAQSEDCYDRFVFAWHTLNPILDCLETASADGSNHIAYDTDNDIDSNTINILKDGGSGSDAIINATHITTAGNNAVFQGNNFNGGARLVMARVNGNLTHPSTILSSQQLGTQQYFGYDGTALAVGASINGSNCAGSSWSTTNHCGMLNFNVVPSGSTTSTQIAQITQYGYTGGKIDYPITTVNTTPYNAVLNDYIILCDASFFSVTINLPTPNANDNRLFMVKRIDTNAPTSCIVATAGAETIDGSNTITLTPTTGVINTGSSIIVAWDGSNWWIVG